MSSICRDMRIAFLAPEIPSVSATFVYEEIYALDAKGLRVFPFSVHRAKEMGREHESLIRRTVYLYDLYSFIKAIFKPSGALKLASVVEAFGMLRCDMRACGVDKSQAWKLPFHFLLGFRLAKDIIRLDCSHLHIHFAHVPAQIGMYAASMAGIPFTVLAHANDIFERGFMLDVKSERASRFLTISEFNRSFLQDKGLRPETLAVVRCGVSFESSSEIVIKNRGNVFRIGCLGRLVEKKGVDVLLRAIKLLVCDGKPVELFVAGDGHLRDSLDALVIELNLSEVVTFQGSLSHSEVKGWMNQLDVFVLACKPDGNGDMDGIPVVLMEAMSQHLPVVSTRLSGIPELIIDGRTGLLADPGDEYSLAHCIERLMSSSELCLELAHNGALHVQNEFGQELNISRLLTYFKEA